MIKAMLTSSPCSFHSAAQTAPAASAPSAVEMPGFSGCKDAVLDLATLAASNPEGSCVPKDVLLRDLTGCTVKMYEFLLHACHFGRSHDGAAC